MNEPRLNLPELTVSELSAALKRTIEDVYGFVRVRGELGKVSYHSSGHIYFDLKDDRACISGVVWRSAAARIKLKLEAGLEVVVTGRLTTYPGRSQYQIVVETLEPAGLGALMALLEERKRRLSAEGLFDEARKQLLPYLPAVIGVITSPTGAVIRDILHRLADRFPRHVLVWPVKVQGEDSAKEVAAAIAGFNALPERGSPRRPDLLIVARGGGSLEDLWSFNEEIVVRAAARSFIPLISAVGHETDVTLLDFVADRRAPTPTAAAEMAVPVRSELIVDVGRLTKRAVAGWLRAHEARHNALRSAARALPNAEALLDSPRQRLDHASHILGRALRANAHLHRVALSRVGGRLSTHVLRTHVERRRDRYNNIALRLRASAAANLAAHRTAVARGRERLGVLGKRADRAVDNVLDARWARWERNSQLLAAFSYRGVLARGFALVRDRGGRPLRTATAVAIGARIDIEFSDGRVGARADSVQTSSGSHVERPRRRRRQPVDPGQGDLFSSRSVCASAPVAMRRTKNDRLFISIRDGMTVYSLLFLKSRRRGTANLLRYYEFGRDEFIQRRARMIRMAFAIAVAVFIVAAGAGVSRAAPIAPLPAGVANDAASGNVTQVWCRWGRCGWGWGYRRWGYGRGWCYWHPRACGW